MKHIAPIGITLAGIYWAYKSIFDYDLWINKGPGPGLVPLIGAILVIVCGIIILIKGFSNQESVKFDMHVLYPFLGVAGILLATQLIGLILSLLIFMFLWLKLMEKYPLKKCILPSILCPAMLYGVFVLWLGVPLPQGLLGLV